MATRLLYGHSSILTAIKACHASCEYFASPRFGEARGIVVCVLLLAFASSNGAIARTAHRAVIHDMWRTRRPHTSAPPAFLRAFLFQRSGCCKGGGGRFIFVHILCDSLHASVPYASSLARSFVDQRTPSSMPP
eukprot:scaffold2884_cov363-Pavlova_lutheri.AAC.3